MKVNGWLWWFAFMVPLSIFFLPLPVTSTNPLITSVPVWDRVFLWGTWESMTLGAFLGIEYGGDFLD